MKFSFSFRRRKKQEIVLGSEFSLEAPDNAREVYDLGDGAKAAIVDRQYVVLEPPKPENLDEIIKNVTLRYVEIQQGSEEEKFLRAFLDYAAEVGMSAEEASIAWYHVRNTCLRAGRITPLLTDPNVEDISCSGSGKPVFVYHSKYGYMPTNIVFAAKELWSFIHSVATKAGFTLSYDSPTVDTTLYDGSRINITISVSKEPSFTIRKVKIEPYTPVRLIRFGTITPKIAALLWLAIENRCSLMFIGGTAAGKTTAMNAAAFFIPPNSKIISIEDTYELMLPHENWTALITKGNITQLDLVKVALRQRPEYVIVGEARGLEVREMFSAMGIGHTVLTTFHGATARTVFRRLSGEPFLIKKDQLTLLDFVVTMAFVEGKRRCVALDLVGVDEGERLIGDIYALRIAGFEKGKFFERNLDAAFERMADKSFRSAEKIAKEFEKRVEIVKKLPEDPIKFFRALGKYAGGGE